MNQNYKLYSIARTPNVKSHVGSFDYNGDATKGESGSIDTEMAKLVISEAINNGLTVLKLPIDCDSDYYDKYIVL